MGQGMTRPGGLCSCCQGKRCAGWWQPVTSAARRPDGVNQRHISGSSRCPGGQQLGGFCRAWMLFWKSKTSVAGLDKGCGLSAFCEAKQAQRRAGTLWGRLSCSAHGGCRALVHELALDGSVPHGHILLSQQKTVKKGMFELVFSVPQSPGLSPNLSPSSFNVLRDWLREVKSCPLKKHTHLFLWLTLKSHVPGGQGSPSHWWGSAARFGQLWCDLMRPRHCCSLQPTAKLLQLPLTFVKPFGHLLL